MFTITEPAKEFEALNERCRDLISQILSMINIEPESFKLRADTSLYEQDKDKEFFYIVREGNLSYSLKDRTLFYFQEGDCIGFERDIDVFTPTITSDFTVIFDRYPQQKFLELVHKDSQLLSLWQEYLGRYIAALYVVARSFFKESETVVPVVKTFSEGSVIIQQGSTADEVMTLADGIAEIVKDDQVVCVLESDAVFGLISAVTASPREASVIAKSDCLVLSMNSKSYFELLQSRPALAKTLITDLAQNIISAHKQLAGALIKL